MCYESEFCALKFQMMIHALKCELCVKDYVKCMLWSFKIDSSIPSFIELCEHVLWIKMKDYVVCFDISWILQMHALKCELCALKLCEMYALKFQKFWTLCEMYALKFGEFYKSFTKIVVWNFNACFEISRLRELCALKLCLEVSRILQTFYKDWAWNFKIKCKLWNF